MYINPAPQPKNHPKNTANPAKVGINELINPPDSVNQAPMTNPVFGLYFKIILEPRNKVDDIQTICTATIKKVSCIVSELLKCL